MRKTYGIVGNPNSGKTSIFNSLTGLNQKVGNYPGVTVDRKVGSMTLGQETVDVVDLPGAYSVYAQSEDEAVSIKLLIDQNDKDYPETVIVVIDATNLDRNLLFLSQIKDLGFKCVIALTMTDLAEKNGIFIDIKKLREELEVPIVTMNPRKGTDTQALKDALLSIQLDTSEPDSEETEYPLGTELMKSYGFRTPFAALVYACNMDFYTSVLDSTDQKKLEKDLKKNDFNKAKFQAQDIYNRYKEVHAITDKTVRHKEAEDTLTTTDKIDKVLLHPVWGNLILITTLFIVFQVVYKVAEGPMMFIEDLFNTSGNYMHGVLPEHWISDLWIDGIWAGLSGIAIFIPQIVLLFSLINILEESGYMARISFLSDRLLNKTGMSGRSTMPLISSFACAVPSIMATRTIPNKYERMLAIFSIPLLSCSARLPVYIILIGLVIPNDYILGFISKQGLVLLLVYLIGTFFSLFTSYILSRFRKRTDTSGFLLELPLYRKPIWKNVLLSAYEKTRIFVVDAGKIILLISVILWVLASHAPNGNMEKIEEDYTEKYQMSVESLPEDVKDQLSSDQLAASYAGVLGKSIEPLIKPLGFDWKIGIALFTSFAAREVFVSTMSTIYAIGDNSTDTRLMSKMRAATDAEGNKVFTLGTSLALLVFYILAMQCMSTLAIIKRETQSWKFPIVIFVYMTSLAYVMALITQWIF